MAEKAKKGAKSPEAPRKTRVTKDMMFLAFALFVVFIVLFWVFSTSKPIDGSNGGPDNTINYTGNMQEFSESLYNAESVSIVANVTGLEASSSQYVYACGAGLAGSWGKLGKNISMLSIYVIEGDSCTYSSPSLTESQVSNDTFVKTSSECVAEIESANLDPTHVTFYIKYGASYSIFNTKTAFIFVDESFADECSFRIPSSEATSVITSANSS